MKFLIVAATEQEISPFLAHFKLLQQVFMESEKMDVLITGVGMTATSFALGKYVRQPYSFILNVGIAGAFDPKTTLGEVVCVVQDTFSELGAENQSDFISLETLGFGKVTFSAEPLDALPETQSITVNTAHGDANTIEQICARLNPDIESMEGAAVFYAATQLGIPVHQVRSVSNLVENRNKDNWNIPLAVNNLNNWLISFVNKQP